MERPGLASLLEFADETGDVNLESVFNYRITQESLSMIYVDGTRHQMSSSWILQAGYILDSGPEELVKWD